MHIFIDESGSFVPAAGQVAVSLTGALILPSQRLPKIEKKFVRLRQRLPKQNNEVKGRQLNEEQIAEVIDLLRRNEAILEVVAVDMNLLEMVEVQRHKLAQACGATNQLTPQHHPNVRRQLEEIGEKIAGLSDQLYVQSVAMFELVWQSSEIAINYFGQRRPEELSAFHWCLDAKDQARTTNWEDLWATIVTFILQSKSIRQPMSFFEGGDYRYFRRFEGPVPEWLPRPDGVQTLETGVDIKMLVGEHFRYAPGSEAGLELCDIVVNATRRALVGNLQPEGWSGLSSLMIHRNRHYIRMITLQENQSDCGRPAYERILVDGFTRGGRAMLAPRFQG